MGRMLVLATVLCLLQLPVTPDPAALALAAAALLLVLSTVAFGRVPAAAASGGIVVSDLVTAGHRLSGRFRPVSQPGVPGRSLARAPGRMPRPV